MSRYAKKRDKTLVCIHTERCLKLPLFRTHKHTDCLHASILQVWAQGELTDARVTASQLAIGLIDAQSLLESKQTRDNVFILYFAFLHGRGYKTAD